jgi:site-specific recombinase XerD
MKPGLRFIEKYCQFLAKFRQLSATTVTRTRHVCSQWLRFLESRQCNGLLKAEPGHLVAWIDYRRDDKRVKEQTISRELCILRTFYQYCVDFAGLPASPAAFIPEFVCNPAPEQTVLTVDEVFDMLETFDVRNPFGWRNYVLLALLWSTGLRPSELLALTWRDIDLEQGTLLVRKGKGNKQRQLFLNDRVLKNAAKYRKSILAGEQAPVFCTYPNSKRKGIYDCGLSYKQVNGIIHEAACKAGLKIPVTIMTFRHTFATHMYEAGVPVRDIQEMMGHSYRSETSVYIHVTMNSLKRLFNNHVYNEMMGERSDL